ncbi:acetaldehyde dehydrogenase (acetylating) [Streptomyces sp. 5-10]|uniref:acetaldehyde dehydrogenase (acetylating) n=1 Tax=Streptomyces sp. 5-10 TaxID=878925 RepID=UPI00168B9348|nr:acetaldehyde dehydrogenase (acetylating) [Streptomyces sp. 5-10]MBD3003746.1 acetaldehyde dehydrogenase (acetylating) [Streptomyces sp. 5-10]
MKRTGRLSVAVLGVGLIGLDLATKVMRSRSLSCELVAARDERTSGLRQAAALGLPTATDGIRSLVAAPEPFDVVFDATNAAAHAEHAELLRPSGTFLVDLTPSKVGHMVVPSVNGAEALKHADVNMVSCGGQASVPILHAISRRHRIDGAEVVTTAASQSVGRATRLNIDEFVGTTQDAVRDLTGVEDVKAILNISPATPPATFRVTVSAHGGDLTEESVRAAVTAAAARVRSFVGGYRVTACAVDQGQAFVAVEITSSGDRIPRYAGNLDIINAAAIRIAEQYAADRLSLAGAETS